jgi:RND family efflux transporter MFP subunit
VIAPIDGMVIDREATLGELVSPEREALLVLADTSILWVLADVPEVRLAAVTKGAAAIVTVPAVGGDPISGDVSYIAPEVDAATRSARVRVELHNGHLPIRPGMFAQVELAAASGAAATQVLAIPEEAVQTIEGTSVVFVPVEGEDGVFAPRPVKVGPPVGGMVPVLDGIADGQILITAGSFVLKAELGKNSAGHDH